MSLQVVGNVVQWLDSEVDFGNNVLNNVVTISGDAHQTRLAQDIFKQEIRHEKSLQMRDDIREMSKVMIDGIANYLFLGSFLLGTTFVTIIEGKPPLNTNRMLMAAWMCFGFWSIVQTLLSIWLALIFQVHISSSARERLLRRYRYTLSDETIVRRMGGQNILNTFSMFSAMVSNTVHDYLYAPGDPLVPAMGTSDAVLRVKPVAARGTPPFDLCVLYKGQYAWLHEQTVGYSRPQIVDAPSYLLGETLARMHWEYDGLEDVAFRVAGEVTLYICAQCPPLGGGTKGEGEELAPSVDGVRKLFGADVPDWPVNELPVVLAGYHPDWVGETGYGEFQRVEGATISVSANTIEMPVYKIVLARPTSSSGTTTVVLHWRFKTYCEAPIMVLRQGHVHCVEEDWPMAEFTNDVDKVVAYQQYSHRYLIRGVTCLLMTACSLFLARVWPLGNRDAWWLEVTLMAMVLCSAGAFMRANTLHDVFPWPALTMPALNRMDTWERVQPRLSPRDRRAPSAAAVRRSTHAVVESADAAAVLRTSAAVASPAQPQQQPQPQQQQQQQQQLALPATARAPAASGKELPMSGDTLWPSKRALQRANFTTGGASASERQSAGGTVGSGGGRGEPVGGPSASKSPPSSRAQGAEAARIDLQTVSPLAAAAPAEDILALAAKDKPAVPPLALASKPLPARALFNAAGSAASGPAAADGALRSGREEAPKKTATTAPAAVAAPRSPRIAGALFHRTAALARRLARWLLPPELEGAFCPKAADSANKRALDRFTCLLDLLFWASMACLAFSPIAGWHAPPAEAEILDRRLLSSSGAVSARGSLTWTRWDILDRPPLLRPTAAALGEDGTLYLAGGRTLWTLRCEQISSPPRCRFGASPGVFGDVVRGLAASRGRRGGSLVAVGDSAVYRVQLDRLSGVSSTAAREGILDLLRAAEKPLDASLVALHDLGPLAAAAPLDEDHRADAAAGSSLSVVFAGSAGGAGLATALNGSAPGRLRQLARFEQLRGRAVALHVSPGGFSAAAPSSSADADADAGDGSVLWAAGPDGALLTLGLSSGQPLAAFPAPRAAAVAVAAAGDGLPSALGPALRGRAEAASEPSKASSAREAAARVVALTGDGSRLVAVVQEEGSSADGETVAVLSAPLPDFNDLLAAEL